MLSFCALSHSQDIAYIRVIPHVNITVQGVYIHCHLAPRWQSNFFVIVEAV